MTGAPTSTRFADSPSLSARSRVTVLLVLLVVYLLLLLVYLTAGQCFDCEALRDSRPDPVAYSVPLDPPPPPPASPVPTSEAAGADGAAAKKAKPKPVVAAPARIPNKAMTAAPAASTGDATRSGANSAGSGTGGGASGTGTGSGGNSDGSGAGAQPAVKIAGDITATRDYPARTRDQRIGSSVIVALTVGTDGRVRACRVHKPSSDPEADAITCRLARERFRFRPATDRGGNPVEAQFGWQQRWFAP